MKRKLLDKGVLVEMRYAERLGRWKRKDKAEVQGYDVSSGKYKLLLLPPADAAGSVAWASRRREFKVGAVQRRKVVATMPPPPAAGEKHGCQCRRDDRKAGVADGTLEKLLAGAIAQGRGYKARLQALQLDYERLRMAYDDVQALLTKEAYMHDFEDRYRRDVTAADAGGDPLQRRLEGLDPRENEAIVALLRSAQGSVLQRALYKVLGLA